MDAALARLNDPAAVPFETIQSVALAIKAVSAEQRHIGIVYNNPDDPESGTNLLDLAWHYVLSSAPVESGYLWVTPPIEPELGYVLAGLCKKVADRYASPERGIAYALRYDGDGFDINTGEFMDETGHGLTCATFVLAMFASYGIPLLQLMEWPEREKDREWQEYIVGVLRKKGVDEKHVEAVNEQVKRGCARYRPEEVAAAGAAPSLPIGFAYAEELGERIVERLGNVH
ncbi:MAG: hypothetical protein ABJE95_31560 [Byssovorax sp.]